MDYDQFSQKFEEMEAEMGGLSAYTNYQLQNAISWGMLWSVCFVPMQISKLVENLLAEHTHSQFMSYTLQILINMAFIVTANIIFNFKVQKLNHQFLEQNSILEVVQLYLFPYCPICVLFYVTIFELLLRTCKSSINILFHWTASIAIMLVFYTLSTDVNHLLFFLNIIAMDIFSIFIAYDNGKIINPINNQSYITLSLGIFIAFYGFYWLFQIRLMLQLYSFLLYILNAVLIYIHLKRKIYPLYGNTPILVFITNKIIPLSINLLISLNSFK